jgi:hypothetical protein
MAKNLAGLAALGALGLLMSRKQGGSNVPVEERTPIRTFGEDNRYAPDQGPDTTGQGFEMPVSSSQEDMSYATEAFGNRTKTPARTNRTTPSAGQDNLVIPQLPNTPNQTYGQGRATQGPVRMVQGARPTKAYDETQGTAPREEPLQGVHPETAFLPGAGLKTVASLAKMFGNKDKGPYFNQQALANNLTRQLTGPTKAELMARDRAARAEARREQMLNENAANYGLNPSAPGYSATAQSLRENLGGKDFTVKKKGGSIKAKSKAKTKMSSGGTTRSSASKRGDGIASKGRTRGKMY